MRVLKWEANFSFEKESPVVPVWISFPELPNHLYEKKALMLLEKSVGAPLQMDEPTSNCSCPPRPRVCIEFDCRRPTPEKIFIHLRDDISGLNEEGFWQKVIFEKIPCYCSHCFTLGHEMATCKLSTKEKGLCKVMATFKTWRTNLQILAKEICDKAAIPLQENQRNSEKQNSPHDCTTNREAGVPGSSTFEEGEFVLLEIGKNQSEKGERNLKVSTLSKFREVCIPESAKNRQTSNLEDFVTVEDVIEDEDVEVLLPDPGNPVTELLEKKGTSGMQKQNTDISNQPFLVSEQGQEVRYKISEDGVAQEIFSEKEAEALSSGNSKERNRIVDSEKNWATNVSDGPIIQKKELAQSSAQNAALKISFHPAQRKVDPEPKIEGYGSSSKMSLSETDQKGVRSTSWDAEDDFLLKQLELNSPPVTRGRALKFARKKNKRRFG